MSMARSLLTDCCRDEEIYGVSELNEIAKDICIMAYRHSVNAGIFDVFLSNPT